ncbi:single-stranded DNA-binding protein [Micromonospora sp. NPDC049836]|uniref:single-stranded DNA-binding protein n=1 Tax=Micromonospora sp. NPDC049836 TaxID=3364274 RepID=UPI00379EC832
MFDTYVTIVGNVLTAPEWRRTTQSNTLVANFKVASTARRLDRDSGRWVDGNSLRVRVNCWRKLAEGVAASVAVGDPVVVAGRLYTRDWTDDAGNHRTLYELEAVAVGHDLSRGRGRFVRNRPSLATSAVEDAEAERRVHGEATEPVPVTRAPSSFDDRPIDDEFDPLELGGPATGPAIHDGLDEPSSGAFGEPADPFDELTADRGDGLVGGPGGDGDGDDDDGDDSDDGDSVDDAAGVGDDEAAEPGGSVPADGVTRTGRGRRGGRRAAVPA